MAMLTNSKIVPELNELTTTEESSYMVMHDGGKLKKISVANIKESLITPVEKNLEEEIERAKKAEEANSESITAEQERAVEKETELAEDIAEIQENFKWSKLQEKPFEEVDNDTLTVTNGVLKFSKGSYNQLTDRPSIENVTLEGNKTFAELGLEECSILSIEKMFS